MIIYFRCCEKEPSISHVQRYNDYSKKTILRKSWASLAPQITEYDKVIIIHDEVAKETLEWMEKQLTAGLVHLIGIEKHSFDYHQHTVTLMDVLEHEAGGAPEEYHLLVEDDYLFAENALEVMRGTELFPGFSVPYDYIDRYTNPEPTQVILGPHCHWRRINSCTMTIGAKGKLFLDNLVELRKAAPTSNDKVFEEIFTRVPCISPLPGVASHMTMHHASPYFRVQDRWNELSIT